MTHVAATGLTPLFVLGLAFALPACAEDDAYAWLMKINQAARKLNYEGTFVYQSGAQLETMRIVHRVNDGSVAERLIALTGAPREVIRTDSEVRCYLPDQNSIVVEHRGVNGKSFPTIVPDRLRDLEDNYIIEVGKQSRVTGRTAQRILIRPRDDYRYGYQLWADRDTGLLLKAELLNNQGKVLEQFMFTDVRVGGVIPPSALEPQTQGKNMVWYRPDGAERAAGSTHVWGATRLPKGFKLSSSMTRKMPMRDRMAEHLVYTDGLAAVSVFIEKEGSERTSTADGPSRMGALHILGRPIDNHHITVVGEVPPKTVSLIGNSIAHLSQR